MPRISPAANMGYIDLTWHVNMGYNAPVILEMFIFMLRLLLSVAVFGFVWTLVKPRTQFMRIVRAALLVLCLFLVLAVTRSAGG